MQVVPVTGKQTVKEFTSSVSPKGQITLPIEIRRQLGVKPKDKVVITVDGEGVKITPAGAHPLEASFQAVPALREPRTLKKMSEIAHEEQARAASKEGLGTGA